MNFRQLGEQNQDHIIPIRWNGVTYFVRLPPMALEARWVIFCGKPSLQYKAVGGGEWVTIQAEGRHDRAG